MLKKVIQFTNPFNDQQVVEEHYFHISKADLIEMELEEHKDTYTNAKGESLTGMQAKLQRIVDSEDGKAILHEFKDIIRRSYGKKDGDRFVKSREIWEKFEGSEAYSQLLYELLTDAKVSADFIQKIIPNNLDQITAEIAKQAEELEKTEGATAASVSEGAATGREAEILAATADNPVTLTREEIIEMGEQELKSGLAEGRYKLS